MKEELEQLLVELKKAKADHDNVANSPLVVFQCRLAFENGSNALEFCIKKIEAILK